MSQSRLITTEPWFNNTYNARNQIVERLNTCDECEWVVSAYSYTYDDRGLTYEYDLIGNRTAIIKTNNETGKVAEHRKYVYNESSQVVKAEIYDGKKH